ncbi:MAG: GreA/GreB family elongation factor [Planctomycetota bacterium]|nr:GreA/GreB family elongation factor [Planctomycetota bacterium]
MATQSQSDNAGPYAEQVARLVGLVRSGDSDELEAAWMEILEDEAVRLDDLGPVLDEIASQNNAKLMESLLWLLVSIWNEQRGASAALEAVWQVAGLLPDTPTLREEIAALYRAVHARAPAIDILVEMTLLRKDLPPPAAVAAVERLIALPPGTYVSDSRRKSPGRVLGVDAGRKVLAVSFGESDRAYDALSVEALELLEADDFRALAVFDRPRLETLARDDPAGLVQLALKVYGPRMGMKDLKARLAAAVGAEAWSKWWSTVRKEVKHSPLIEMSEGPQPEFFLRQRAVTYEQTARERFDSARKTEDKLLVVLGYLGEAGHNPATEAEMLASFAGDVARLAAPTGGATPAERLAALTVQAEVRRHLGEGAPPAGHSPTAGVAPPPLAAGSEKVGSEKVSGTLRLKVHDTFSDPTFSDPDLAVQAVSVRDDGLAIRILAFLRENLPDRWPDLYAAAMPAASAEVCDHIAADLAAAGRQDLLAAAAAEIVRRPVPCAAALAWLWKNATAEKYAPALADLSRPSMTVRLFQALNEVALTDMPDKGRKLELLVLMRRTLSAKEFATLRDVLDRTDAGWAKEIRTVVSRNTGLSDHLRVQVLDVLSHAHPVPITRDLPPWEEDVIYTTQAALGARQKEFEELVHVKLPQNSSAIGAAAALGDISDNAEFQSALEERGRLTERANAMQADLVKAKPIPRFMAQGGTVNIGTTVRARRLSTGQEETLTFLGPWDAATQKGIYYYKAPLALAFMGKAVGDTVVLQADAGEERWEILEVNPAFPVDTPPPPPYGV